MANVQTKVSASGDYVIGIDDDNDGSTNQFMVQADGSTNILKIDESGNLWSLGSHTATGTVTATSYLATVGSTSPPTGGSDGEIRLTSDSKVWVRFSGTWKSLLCI